MRRWYCIYTKSNYEDQVSRRLAELPGMEILNPKVKARKMLRSKMQERIERLFPCYIFSQFESASYFHMIKYTRGVKRFVGDSNGQPFIVDDGMIELIRSRMEDGMVRLDFPELAPGQEVKIVDGPFAGFTGVFISKLSAQERVSILLNTIQYTARVDVDRSMVE